jgi:alanyl-tRNA synthetase
VRVVSIGDFSKELCGGTHLDSAGQIGLFKIVNEGSVASGIRRIEAVTGAYAYKKVKEEEAIIADISKALNVPKERILTELANRLSKVKELEKQLHSHKLDMAKGSVDAFIEKAQEVNGIKLITEVLENADADFLRSAVDLIKQRINNCVIALGGKGKDKALLVIGLTADLVSKGLDASKLILKPAVAIGGSGGGRKDFALGGGSKPGNFTAAFNELKGLIK